jgi:hypothetical protein
MSFILFTPDESILSNVKRYNSIFSAQNSTKSSTAKKKNEFIPISKFHNQGTTNSRKSKKKKKIPISILELH